MIVSASYRSDIPAFYAEWFRNRFRAGHCRVVNPYGGGAYTVSLRDGVDGFVFWTRNAAPFRDALREVRDAGIPFVVQYTLTGYPHPLDPSVPDAQQALATIRALAAEYGPRAVVWRYDPIVVTDLTPAGHHRVTFARLAEGLAGAVDEVVISFASIYRKTARNLGAAARRHGFAWADPEAGEKRALLTDLAGIAAAQGMACTLCSQPDLLVAGVDGARCVDAARLSAVAARPVAARPKGNRPGCLCHESRDIGDYDSCLHGCVYCYAVAARAAARRRWQAHDPNGEFLIPPAQKSMQRPLRSQSS